MTEWLVPLSLLALAFGLWLGRVPRVAMTGAMVVGAGIGHGYAYGEAILGSEMTPLAWYLFGLIAVQVLLMATPYLLLRHLLTRHPAGIGLTARALSVLLSTVAVFALWSGVSA